MVLAVPKVEMLHVSVIDVDIDNDGRQSSLSLLLSHRSEGERKGWSYTNRWENKNDVAVGGIDEDLEAAVRCAVFRWAWLDLQGLLFSFISCSSSRLAGMQSLQDAFVDNNELSLFIFGLGN